MTPLYRGLFLVIALAVSAAATPAPVVTATTDRVARDLPFRREVLLPPANVPGTWVQIAADSVLARRCAEGFTDIRLTGEDGTVLPLLVLPPRRQDDARRVVSRHEIRWESDGDETPVATVDLGPSGGVRRLIDLPPALRNWMRVRMQTRVPGQDWRGFAPRRPLVAGHSMMVVENLLQLPESAQHVRLFHAAGEPPPLADSLAVVELRPRDVAPRRVAFRAEPPRFSGNKAVLACTVSEPNVHVSGLQLSSELGPYASHVTVYARDNRRAWRRVSMDLLPRGVELTFSPIEAGELRIEVSGVDPPEAPFHVVAVQTHDTRFVFPHPGPGRYWLLYGDHWRAPRAGPAEARFLAAPTVSSAALGPEAGNPIYEKPGLGLRWLQRRPGVVTVVMLALLAVVVWVAVTPARRRDERG